MRLYNYALSATQIGALANTPPVLAAISNRVVRAGTSLLITNTATDAESPPQILTYSLANTPPTGVTLNSTSGLFSWRPGIAQSGTTNLFSLRVSDNGTPSLSVTQNFTVTVTRPATPSFANTVFSNNQLRLQISGDAGPDYTIQGSTNLQNWTSLWTTNPATLPFLFTDPGSTNYRQRFYRIQLGP